MKAFVFIIWLAILIGSCILGNCFPSNGWLIGQIAGTLCLPLITFVMNDGEDF